MNIVAFLGVIEIGLVFGLAAFGVFPSFRVLSFPDLTAEGIPQQRLRPAIRPATGLEFRRGRAIFDRP